jgi:hypothetical protein
MKAKIARFITIFFCGFLLMLTISIFNDWTYEREMLSNLRDHVYSKCQSRDITTVVDTALYYSHMLQEPATNIYFGKKFHSLKRFLVPSSFQNFYFGADACGAYASFFVRLMSSAGYRAQITQVNIRYKKNAHMTVCIFADNKMYVVDPLFGHDFKGPDGKLSDIRDVSKNWYTYYSKHVPPSYQELYNYQYGWSFTNWNKFGVVSRTMYKTLCFVLGKDRVDTFSLRYYTQGYNKFFWLFSFIGFVFTLIHALRLNFNHSMGQYLTFKFSNWYDIFRKTKTDP